MQVTLYDFFRDQGTTLAGLLALLAGGVAYCGARGSSNSSSDPCPAADAAAFIFEESPIRRNSAANP